MRSVAEAVRSVGPPTSGSWAGRGRAAPRGAVRGGSNAEEGGVLACLPVATGCLKEADRTGAVGVAGPTKPYSDSL
jgi:hypothetical protein